MTGKQKKVKKQIKAGGGTLFHIIEEKIQQDLKTMLSKNIQVLFVYLQMEWLIELIISLRIKKKTGYGYLLTWMVKK